MLFEDIFVLEELLLPILLPFYHFQEILVVGKSDVYKELKKIKKKILLFEHMFVLEELLLPLLLPFYHCL